ncbi:MAG: glycosyltransferase family 4 protein [Armatimonadota bacterium]|nr:glycosyltransferase family 4 protein [Armatimonadota bacterium]MDR7468105.1 glycosyltransferase family 4 protein [Armatimonadota bacterium]MDR7494675.1 glycosyltransferase family 4 protein [Armatimonadota bacterium]MDR7505601.1 glycosyltransferase family 4 protein [Armatimonadota bacterium]
MNVKHEVTGATRGTTLSERVRVLFLATRDWRHPQAAGGDVQMWEYARYLASRGHFVTFMASRFPGAPTRERLEGINVVRLGSIYSLWLSTFLYYIRECRRRYDVVVSEGLGGSRIPRLSPLYVKEPMITEWHQVHDPLFRAQYPRVLVPLLNAVERFTAYVHRNTLVQALTEEAREAFLRLGFKPGNVFVLPVSIRNEWICDIRPSVTTQPTVLWLGKFRRYKCPMHIIEAARQVVRQLPDSKFLFVGREDDRKLYRLLRDATREYELTKHVEFRLNVSEEEKKDILRGSRVLVVPSSIEGFGIAILEANVFGVPVVASSGVPPSVAQDGFNGLRYQFGDTSALARCIVQILTDNSLHRRLSENARRFAEQFAWSSVGRRFEDLVTSIVNEQRKKDSYNSTAKRVRQNVG